MSHFANARSQSSPTSMLGSIVSAIHLLPIRKSNRANDETRLFDDSLVEHLEDRQLMAGDVSVVVANNGDVRITGDNDDNQFTFIRDGNGNLYVAGENGTTVNGQVTAGLGTTDVERRLIINMRGGDDFVRLNEVAIDDDVVINGGNGNDLIFVRDSGMQTLTVHSAAGSDMVVLNDNYIADTLTLRTGADADFVFIDRCNRMFDDVNIVTGGGDDRVFLAGAEFHADATVTTGAGSDTIILEHVHTAGSFTARTGSGPDAFVVDGDPPTANELFHGGAGADGYIGEQFAPAPDTQSVEETFAVPMVNINSLSEVFKNEFVARGGVANEMLCNIIQT